ncbi:helix-turn-helix domain-containing protein [Chitinophaga qingshengii]|uniref:AraC family transcriptional regulator n=1 Tax=Chitinophaga qingshengii TaxID=1569794 RepID=A0ABR7THJ7_9BACT|nr:helix-turn-helix domain-containing protein [Chitinophaga qingshengii]MBC9929914.1 AraC family transcriptional regulator [Chitinophaga qingshengii]
MYRQYKPHPLLEPYIDAYWTVISSTGSASVSRILPDGCVDIICNLGDAAVGDAEQNERMASEKAYLIGTMTHYTDSCQPGPTHLVGIRFKPAAFNSFYRLPLLDTADNCIEFGQELVPLLLRAGDNFIPVLDKYLLERNTHASRDMLPIIDTLHRHQGVIRIGDLARTHFLTPRQLERQFLKHTGVSPKAFANIVRYQAVQRHIRSKPGSSLLQIAYDYGYYDHAHLTNEIRKYTGKAPSSLVTK